LRYGELWLACTSGELQQCSSSSKLAYAVETGVKMSSSLPCSSLLQQNAHVAACTVRQSTVSYLPLIHFTPSQKLCGSGSNYIQLLLCCIVLYYSAPFPSYVTAMLLHCAVPRYTLRWCCTLRACELPVIGVQHVPSLTRTICCCCCC
jgi:hypothetical protein